MRLRFVGRTVPNHQSWRKQTNVFCASVCMCGGESDLEEGFYNGEWFQRTAALQAKVLGSEIEPRREVALVRSTHTGDNMNLHYIIYTAELYVRNSSPAKSAPSARLALLSSSTSEGFTEEETSLTVTVPNAANLPTHITPKAGIVWQQYHDKTFVLSVFTNFAREKSDETGPCPTTRKGSTVRSTECALVGCGVGRGLGCYWHVKVGKGRRSRIGG
jgi:hypothetical protein